MNFFYKESKSNKNKKFWQVGGEGRRGGARVSDFFFSKESKSEKKQEGHSGPKSLTCVVCEARIISNYFTNAGIKQEHHMRVPMLGCSCI